MRCQRAGKRVGRTPTYASTTAPVGVRPHVWVPQDLACRRAAPRGCVTRLRPLDRQAALPRGATLETWRRIGVWPGSVPEIGSKVQPTLRRTWPMRTFAAAGSLSVADTGVTVRRLDDPDLTYQHTGSGHLPSRGPACLRARRGTRCLATITPGRVRQVADAVRASWQPDTASAQSSDSARARWGFGALLRAAQGRRGLPARPRQLDGRHPDPGTPAGFRPVWHRLPDRRSGRRPARPSGLTEAHHRQDGDGRPVGERAGATGPQGCATPQSAQLLEGATPTRTTGSTLGHRRPVRGALASRTAAMRTYQTHLTAAARHSFSQSEALCSDGFVHRGLRVARARPVGWRTSSLGSRLKSGLKSARARQARARPWLPSWIGWGPWRGNSSGPRPARPD